MSDRARRQPDVPPIRPGRMGSAVDGRGGFTMLRRPKAKNLRRPPLQGLHHFDPRGGRGAELRKEIASYLRSARGIRLHVDRVMITSGSQ